MTQLDILTLGKKIKKIRKSINATQKDVCCYNIDRSYISKIENDKVKGGNTYYRFDNGDKKIVEKVVIGEHTFFQSWRLLI